MRSLAAISALIVLFAAGWSSPGAAEANARRVLLSEDFESDGAFQFWTGNGTTEVNFAGPTDEKAASGKRSFTIDITFQKDSTYNYWYIPVEAMVPFYGKPQVSGKLHIERGSARLGYAWTDPGDRTTDEAGGQVGMGVQDHALPDGWGEWSASAEGAAESVKHLNAIVLLVYPDAEGRVVVYIDDLKLDAALPEDYEPTFKGRLAQLANERKAHVAGAGHVLRSRWQALASRLKALPAELPVPVSPTIAECWQQRQAYSAKTAEELDGKLAQLQTAPGNAAIDSAWPLLRSLERVQASAASFLQHAKPQSAQTWPIWIIEPISDDKVFSDKFPLTDPLGTQLRVVACRGEYEPASFAVRALDDKPISDLLAVPSDAIGGDFTIPASAIDVRIVKCWWQAGRSIMESNYPTYTPELLLKDADYVRVNDAKKQNRLRDPEAPRDADQLLPVTVPAGTTQQFWVTVHVPQDAPPGTYESTIELRAADTPPVSLALEIEVLPFDLDQPRLEYSMYYNGVLTDDGAGSLTMRNKSPEQYLAEMRNMKAHGVSNPQFPQQTGPLVDQAMELRQRAGLAIDPLYLCGIAVAGLSPEYPGDPMQIHPLLKQLAKYDIEQLYIYGIDEAKGGELIAERPLIESAHALNFKVYQACGADAADLIGDLLDLAVVDRLMPSQAEQWHALGKRIFSYANPMVGNVQPETFRRNYGLALWRAGYDGAMDWAYQHDFGISIVEAADSDINGVRMYAFAYPTADGVIDTIQWEGFREGIDDVRYLSTLLSAIERAGADSAGGDLAAQAEQWLQAMNPQDHPRALRKRMIEWIVQLKK